FLYIVDRVKDLVMRGGENILGVEAEDALYERPDVIDAAVVGVPHETLLVVVEVVVQLRDGATATPDEIRAVCAELLALFHVPRLRATSGGPAPPRHPTLPGR